MKGAGKRDPRPADSPGRLRQVENGKKQAVHLKPFKPGECGNREGKNGAKWLSEFRQFFDGDGGNDRSRFYNVCNALYIRAIKGSDQAQLTIINHMKGRAHEVREEEDATKLGGGVFVLALPAAPMSAEEWESTLGPLCAKAGEPPKSG